MMSRPWHFLLAFLLCAAGGAHAAISCSLGAVSGLATLYDGLASADTLDSGTYVVNCSRTSTGDPASVTFKTNVDAGANAQGSNSRVRLGATASYVRYDLYTSSAYSTAWGSQSSKAQNGTVSFSGTNLTGSTTMTFYSSVGARQTAPQGLYTDTVTITLTYGASNTVAPAASLSVSVSPIPACLFASTPGNIAFTYTAFSASPVPASTTFGARCSTTLAYTVSLDAASGVVAGLRYTLSLSPPAGGGTGNGSVQTYTILGSMEAGQAGSCAGACSGSNNHSVTISY